jgi:hypothetical protein
VPNPYDYYTWPTWTTTQTTSITMTNNSWNTWTATTSSTASTIRLLSDTWEWWTQRYDHLTWRNEVWGNWTTQATAPIARATRQLQPLQPQRTEEEWRAIREENERLRAERDKVQAVARAEARKLLELVLTQEQLASFDRDKFFDVIGSHGTTYRVRHGVSGNISQLVDGREVSVLCVHPSLYDADRGAYLPTEDSIVAQVLALKTDELEVVTRANVHRGRRHLAVVRDAA